MWWSRDKLGRSHIAPQPDNRQHPILAWRFVTRIDLRQRCLVAEKIAGCNDVKQPVHGSGRFRLAVEVAHGRDSSLLKRPMTDTLYGLFQERSFWGTFLQIC